MKQYLDFLKETLEHGVYKDDRTGVGVYSRFGAQLRFHLQEGFPLVTTKRIHFKSVVCELLWFLRGETNVRSLQSQGVRIWNEWADEQGELGPIYGKQWRAWEGAHGKVIDQIAWVLNEIRENPSSRRLLVSAWNVAELDKMALPPCHTFFQFYVIENKLSCQLYMRSLDSFLGVPFNIASYALLTHIVAQQTNLIPWEFILTGGDVHIYKNHLPQVKEQLTRTPYPLPKLKIARLPSDISNYEFNDFILEEYQHHLAIHGAVAI